MRAKARHVCLTQLSTLKSQLAFTFLPPSPPKRFRGLAQWEVVSSYSSATAPDSHGISCADPLFQARKELDRELAPRTRRFKIYLVPSHKPAAKCDNGAVGRQRFFLF